MLKPLCPLVISIAAALTASSASAAEFLLQDPCALTPWLDQQMDGVVGQSVGAATIATLAAHDVAFVGSPSGISSIKGTVTGDRALEVISDREMRAYGWCYHLNGVEPNAFPDSVLITAASDRIEWFFGYAHYKNGEWIATCVPTHLLRPAFICSEVP